MQARRSPDAPPPGPRFGDAEAVTRWRSRIGAEGPLAGRLEGALLARFLAPPSPDDPAALAPLVGRPVLLLANHQVAIETPLFALAAAAGFEGPVTALAKIEHRESWLGRLGAHCLRYPAARPPSGPRFVDRGDAAEMLAAARAIGAAVERDGLSLLVHAEGTRARRAGAPTKRLSGVLLDLAVALGLPVVPVRFAGALPVAPAPRPLDFPLGFARQRVHLGAPLAPETFAGLATGARRDLALEALNAAGPDLAAETPASADPAFARAALATMRRFDLPPRQAVILQAIAADPAAAALHGQLVARLEGRAPPPAPAGEAAWLDGLALWLRGRG